MATNTPYYNSIGGGNRDILISDLLSGRMKSLDGGLGSYLGGKYAPIAYGGASLDTGGEYLSNLLKGIALNLELSKSPPSPSPAPTDLSSVLSSLYSQYSNPYSGLKSPWNVEDSGSGTWSSMLNIPSTETPTGLPGSITAYPQTEASPLSRETMATDPNALSILSTALLGPGITNFLGLTTPESKEAFPTPTGIPGYMTKAASLAASLLGIPGVSYITRQFVNPLVSTIQKNYNTAQTAKEMARYSDLLNLADPYSAVTDPYSIYSDLLNEADPFSMAVSLADAAALGGVAPGYGYSVDAGYGGYMDGYGATAADAAAGSIGGEAGGWGWGDGGGDGGGDGK